MDPAFNLVSLLPLVFLAAFCVGALPALPAALLACASVAVLSLLLAARRPAAAAASAARSRAAAAAGARALASRAAIDAVFAAAAAPARAPVDGGGGTAAAGASPPAARPAPHPARSPAAGAPLSASSLVGALPRRSASRGTAMGGGGGAPAGGERAPAPSSVVAYSLWRRSGGTGGAPVSSPARALAGGSPPRPAAASPAGGVASPAERARLDRALGAAGLLPGGVPPLRLPPQQPQPPGAPLTAPPPGATAQRDARLQRWLDDAAREAANAGAADVQPSGRVMDLCKALSAEQRAKAEAEEQRRKAEERERRMVEEARARAAMAEAAEREAEKKRASSLRGEAPPPAVGLPAPKGPAEPTLTLTAEDFLSSHNAAVKNLVQSLDIVDEVYTARDDCRAMVLVPRILLTSKDGAVTSKYEEEGTYADFFLTEEATRVGFSRVKLDAAAHEEAVWKHGGWTTTPDAHFEQTFVPAPARGNAAAVVRTFMKVLVSTGQSSRKMEKMEVQVSRDAALLRVAHALDAKAGAGGEWLVDLVCDTLVSRAACGAGPRGFWDPRHDKADLECSAKSTASTAECCDEPKPCDRCGEECGEKFLWCSTHMGHSHQEQPPPSIIRPAVDEARKLLDVMQELESRPSSTGLLHHKLLRRFLAAACVACHALAPDAEDLVVARSLPHLTQQQKDLDERKLNAGVFAEAQRCMCILYAAVLHEAADSRRSWVCSIRELGLRNAWRVLAVVCNAKSSGTLDNTLLPAEGVVALGEAHAAYALFHVLGYKLRERYREGANKLLRAVKNWATKRRADVTAALPPEVRALNSQRRYAKWKKEDAQSEEAFSRLQQVRALAVARALDLVEVMEFPQWDPFRP
jgi:hypothetical protein